MGLSFTSRSPYKHTHTSACYPPPPDLPLYSYHFLLRLGRTTRHVGSLYRSRYTTFCLVVRSLCGRFARNMIDQRQGVTHTLQDHTCETWHGNDTAQAVEVVLRADLQKKEITRVSERFRIRGQRGLSLHWKRKTACAYCGTAGTTQSQVPEELVCLYSSRN